MTECKQSEDGPLDSTRERAEAWLREMRAANLANWEEPSVGVMPEEVMYEWWEGTKKMSVYFDDRPCDDEIISSWTNDDGSYSANIPVMETNLGVYVYQWLKGNKR